MMKQSGNSKLRAWLSERGVPNNMRISAKYHTPDAEYYGRRLKAQVCVCVCGGALPETLAP